MTLASSASTRAPAPATTVPHSSRILGNATSSAPCAFGADLTTSATLPWSIITAPAPLGSIVAKRAVSRAGTIGVAISRCASHPPFTFSSPGHDFVTESVTNAEGGTEGTRDTFSSRFRRSFSEQTANWRCECPAQALMGIHRPPVSGSCVSQ